MPTLLTPGVYIQEVALGPSPIQGVSTSVAGLVGETVRGPTTGAPSLVVSFADFVNQFGGFSTGKMLAYAVQGFFANGGQQAFISRVVNASVTTPASLTLNAAGYFVRVVGNSSPAPGGGTNVALSSVVGITITANISFIALATGTVTTGTVTAVNPTSGLVTVSQTITGVGSATHYAQIAPAASGSPPVLPLQARDLGFFGNQISVYAEAYYSNSTAVVGASSAVLTLASVAFLSVNQQVQLDVAGSREIGVVKSVNAANNTVTLYAAPGASYAGGKLSLVSWRVIVAYQGVVVETLTGLSSALDAGITGNAVAFANGINTTSSWIRVPTPATLSASPADFPSFSLAQLQLFTGPASTDPAAAPLDVVGTDVPPRSGLKAIEAQDGISIIAAPGYGSGVPVPPTGPAIYDVVVGELIGQAERKQDRVAVFETLDASNPGVTPPVDVNALLNERGKWNSQYAAMYAPWLTVVDPLSGANISVPPSGHVIGAYAATDNLRGVFKSPANVVLQNIVGFSRDIPTAEQDLLNPAGVNVLRNFPGLGNVIWGARTIAADSLWRYISVRRLFIFIEQSLVQGTRYAVFEPNDLKLWARLRDSVANFLTTQWQAGALFGATAAQAFFVRVDETTTTQDDRDNGIVNILVGIAPVKPAEFIVFQIGQAPESVIIAEQGS